MSADGTASLGKLRPQPGVDSGDGEIENEDWEPGEHRFHEGLTTKAPLGAIRPVNPKQQLGGCQGRKSKIFPRESKNQSVGGKTSPFKLNDHAGINQEGH